jgi:hypothetical protein
VTPLTQTAEPATLPSMPRCLAALQP